MTSLGKVDAGNGDWLVGNPTGAQLASALWIGSVGLLILGLQPVLLGALYTEGHVSGDELALLNALSGRLDASAALASRTGGSHIEAWLRSRRG